MTDWSYIISGLISLLAGGGIGGLISWRAQKKQASATAQQYVANAESSEIDNVDKIARLWRESLEAREKYFSEQMTILNARIDSLNATVAKLTRTNNQILKLLQEANHDNLEQQKAEAQKLTGN